MAAALPKTGGSRDRFTPEEQAVAVWLSHIVILSAVVLITKVGLERWPPNGFVWSEIVILVMFLTLVPSWESLTSFVGRYLSKQRRESIADWPERYRQKGRPVAFAVTFVLQFVAITPLLTETGGPIDSPFAQLAVAFAVFTPLLANRYPTIAIALVGSLAYYGAMIWTHGFDETLEQPAPGVFFAVTSLIVILTVSLTVLDRVDNERRLGDRNGS
jgi:hypothetical protein